VNTATANLEERLTQLKQEVPTLGLERYPSRLKNLADLPPELQSPAMMKLTASETIQTIIAFPPQILRGWHYVPKQALLFTPTGVIHLLASIWPDQGPQITGLNGCNLFYMRVSLLLLYGFLEIVAQGPGSPTQIGLEFNTVAWDYYLSTPVRRLLQLAKVTNGESTDETVHTPSAQKAIEKLPLKFSNGTQIYGLLPGEELEDLVFQPGTWQRRLVLFRRPILPNTLLLLTTNFLVVIQEELGIEQGWIISYIPRNNIAEMQNQPSCLWNELTVQLEREGQSVGYKLLLTNEAVNTWRRQWIQHGGLWQDLPDESQRNPEKIMNATVSNT